MSVEPKSPADPSFESRVHGSLLGGALGDSLGYAVEFDSIAAIRARYGSEGLKTFGQLDGASHFSDDTQMTLYTVDGLVEALEWANDGVAADEIACLWLAYLRWLATQDVAVDSAAPVPQPRWIDAQEVLRHRRAPGNACLSGLATGTMGTVARPVNADSKGCGTVMRSAPFGLIPHISREAVYKLSSDAASLTHGHPSARLSAAAFSLLIHNIVAGMDVRTAATEALNYVNAVPTKAPELAERLEGALQLSLRPAPLDPEELTTALGEGWIAEEALAVGLYAVLATKGGTPAEHFRNAIAVAINHSGDSDSTGSITGNILGAYYGLACLPADWLEALEAPEVIRGMADRLLAVTTG
ncbi:ADP-ribosylglycohydrolase family protein [Paenarthrobacter sp. TYUT067]|uniref:ADP-ribosylglycohydrolase family protein n=1 Tax=Paenarthrobacter sp. TYUT067 TaxID=2926245 RepID=UPI002030FE1B|nr:ADP-ribosylglycohydrolase family protein [Paenarthrobacter sp. TYUT067]MCM0614859.1 ADP-ribosylglycohydrolase family protein [Paenarthrobacter sp. TYUT067]